MATAATHIPSTRSLRFPNNLPPGWKAHLQSEIEKPYFRKLVAFLKQEYLSKRNIFPPREQILRALQMVDYDDVKVVILGQDPYHGTRQALGLCFGVPTELDRKPPSLINIFQEIESDLKVSMKGSKTELTGWARQGVLLLNTVLTVRESTAFSHRNKGWEEFTDHIIKLLNEHERPIIFLLWGSAAQSKSLLITNRRHFILKAAHPSPLSAYKGFFGCKHFSKTNEILINNLGLPPIDWSKTSDS